MFDLANWQFVYLFFKKMELLQMFLNMFLSSPYPPHTPFFLLPLLMGGVFCTIQILTHLADPALSHHVVGYVIERPVGSSVSPNDAPLGPLPSSFLNKRLRPPGSCDVHIPGGTASTVYVIHLGKWRACESGPHSSHKKVKKKTYVEEGRTGEERSTLCKGWRSTLKENSHNRCFPEYIYSIRVSSTFFCN